jgi:hypothetical protein
VPLDKELKKSLPKDGRPYTPLEAMFSFSCDIDDGNKWTIKGYSKLWGWSRCKVRSFVNSIRHPTGHTLDTLKTHLRHTVHFIDKGLWEEKDTLETPFRHPLDTPLDPTIYPNPKNNKTIDHLHDRFSDFWKIYPNKIGKKPCAKKWKVRNLNKIADKIIDDVKWRKENDEKWVKGFVPNPLTYINQDRWEDDKQVSGEERPAITLNEEQRLHLERLQNEDI